MGNALPGNGVGVGGGALGQAERRKLPGDGELS